MNKFKSNILSVNTNVLSTVSMQTRSNIIFCICKTAESWDPYFFKAVLGAFVKNTSAGMTFWNLYGSLCNPMMGMPRLCICFFKCRSRQMSSDNCKIFNERNRVICYEMNLEFE